MLTELHIQNFAIIDKLDLRFGPGLIILTGETGAGKSIILDAVVMLIGGKADTTYVRTESDAALVEGVFQLKGPEKEAVHEVLKREELMDDPNYVTLAREIRKEGRSVARVNGRTVAVSLLKEIGALVVDIHGQAEHLSLLDSRAHLGLLDRFAEISRPLSDYRQTYHALLNLRRELNELRKAQADADRKIEMLTYQAEEIEAARLKPGEDEELRKERDRLANAESLAQNAQEALAILDEGSPEMPAASDLVGQAAQALGALAKLDPAQNELATQADVLLDTMSEIVHNLRNYLEEIEFNPKRLDEVEERLDLIHSLARKYGGSIPAVIAYGGDARKQLETITGAAERIEELELELIDAGLQEIIVEEDKVWAYADYTDFGTLSKALEDKGIEVTKANLQRIPNSPVEFSEEQLEDIEKMLHRSSKILEIPIDSAGAKSISRSSRRTPSDTSVQPLWNCCQCHRGPAVRTRARVREHTRR